MTQFNERLFVEIVPLDNERPPQPHPIQHGKFDPALIYKVLGIYNPSETSECYFMMANPEREIWFIPQRHVRAYALIKSDEFFLPRQSGDGNGHSAGGKSSMAGPMSTLPVGSNRLP
jgi:hypothetical protein